MARVRAAQVFMDQRNPGSLFALDNPTKYEIEMLAAHRDDNNMKARFTYVDGIMEIRFPTVVHERVLNIFNDTVGAWNSGVSGDSDEPIGRRGAARVNMNEGFNCEPDAQCQVPNRFHCSPNVVWECHYMYDGTSAAAMTKFHNKLMRYITDTPDVMVVIGIKVYPAEINRSFCALAIVYHRTGPFTAELTRFTSFGTAALPQPLQQFWNNLLQGQIDGFGVLNNPPCNIQTSEIPLYTIEVQMRHVLSIDNDGTVFLNEMDAPNMAPLTFRLLSVQRAITRAFTLM